MERGTLSFQKNEAGQRLVPESEIERIQASVGVPIAPASVSIDGDKGHFTTPANASVDISDSAELLRGRNLDPDEWEITSLRVNEWDGMNGETLTQLRVNVVRKPSWILQPAFEPDDYVAPKRSKPQIKDGKLVVFVGDQQAPFHDEELHRVFCDWLETNNPDEGVLMGDTVDFPDISRHAGNPEHDRTPMDCINSGYVILRDYVQASTNTHWQKLMGNHDERIRARLINFHTGLHGLRQADIPGEPQEAPVYCMSNLLRLKALGIDFIDPNGPYQSGQVKVSDKLAARHGWIARKGAGASALGTLEHLGYSVIVGHTHRQGLVHQTKHDIDGSTSTLAAVETGCMCKIDGLGYTVAPDWQQGFATATVYNDGTFKLDLATFVNKTLYWRNQRYE